MPGSARAAGDQPVDQVGDHLLLRRTVVRPQRREAARRGRRGRRGTRCPRRPRTRDRPRSRGRGRRRSAVGRRSSPRPGCGSSSVRDGRPVVRSSAARPPAAAAGCARRRRCPTTSAAPASPSPARPASRCRPPAARPGGRRACRRPGRGRRPAAARWCTARPSGTARSSRSARVRWPAARHERLQPGPRAAGVGGDVDQPPRPRDAVPGDDVDELRRHALQHGEPLGVGGHLQQRGDLQLAGELGVGDLVGPVAEDATACRRGAGSRPGRPRRRRRTCPGRRRRRRGASPRRSAPPRDVVPRRRRPSAISTTDLPSAFSDSRYFFSCSRPRSKTSCTSSGVSASGAAHSPAATPRSSRVRCAHSWWCVRSVGLSTSRPSSRCIAPCLPIAVVRQPAGCVRTTLPRPGIADGTDTNRRPTAAGADRHPNGRRLSLRSENYSAESSVAAAWAAFRHCRRASRTVPYSGWARVGRLIERWRQLRDHLSLHRPRLLMHGPGQRQVLTHPLVQTQLVVGHEQRTVGKATAPALLLDGRSEARARRNVDCPVVPRMWLPTTLLRSVARDDGPLRAMPTYTSSCPPSGCRGPVIPGSAPGSDHHA